MTTEEIQSLRDRFFEQCTDEVSIWEGETDKEPKMKKVNMTPHNLFEWFISQPELKAVTDGEELSSELPANSITGKEDLDNYDVASERLRENSEDVFDFLPNDFVASKEQSQTEVATPPCTVGNSIEQNETLYLYDSIEDRTMEEFGSIEEIEKFVKDYYVIDGDVHPDIESLNIYKKVGGVYVEETGGTIVRQDDIVPVVKVKVLLTTSQQSPSK